MKRHHITSFFCRWFRQVTDADTGCSSHIYNGGYWKAKLDRDFTACPSIYWWIKKKCASWKKNRRTILRRNTRWIVLKEEVLTEVWWIEVFHSYSLSTMLKMKKIWENVVLLLAWCCGIRLYTVEMIVSDKHGFKRVVDYAQKDKYYLMSNAFTKQ